MKILIVDDNESIRNMVIKTLKLKGDYEVETAENGEDALEKYEKFGPDVVLLDIAMPVMDGIETLTQLRKKDPNAVVIMATASGSSRNIEECMKKGARAHIEKPFTPEELISTIKNVQETGKDYDKFTNLFSRTANKMEASLRKMTDVPLSLTLKEIIQVPGKEYEKIIDYYATDTSQIKKTKESEVHRIEIPEGSIGITTEIEGQINGIIVTSINRQKLRDVLTGQENASELENEETVFMELFNIINNNQLTELANYTERDMKLIHPRFFDKEKDSIVSGKQFVHVIYEITMIDTYITTKEKQNKIPFDIFCTLST